MSLHNYVGNFDIFNVEQYSLTGTIGNDLFLYSGGSRYAGGEGTDTFYADWSESTNSIVWDNDPSSTVTIQGAELSGLERLLIATGSGDDVIRNTKVTASDYIDTGAGNDTIETVSGSDTIYSGSGDDQIMVGEGSGVIIDAGSGNDTIKIGMVSGGGLNVDCGTGFDKVDADFSAWNANFWGAIEWRLDSDGTRLGPWSSFADLHNALANGQDKVSLHNYVGNFDISNVEQYSLTGTIGNDLFLYSGGSRYAGGEGTDTFYADWSESTNSIVWDNDPSSTVTIQGAELSGLERLLLVTGSGNDVIRNTKVATDDYIDTGAGNDVIEGGNGNDTIRCGDGLDTAVFTGNSTDYVINYDAATNTYTVTDNVANRDGTDSINGVELFKFADETQSVIGAVHNLTGSVTFWKTGLPITAITSTLASSPAATGTHPIEFRNIQTAADGSRTIEIWETSPTTAINSVQLDLVLPTGSTSTWHDAIGLPSGWSSLANTDKPGQFILGGIGTTALSAGSVNLGTLTLTVPTNMHHFELALMTGQLGNDAIPAFSISSDSMPTGTDGLYQHLDMADGTYTLTSAKVSGTAESNAVKANDALAALKIAVGINPNADGSAVSPYQYLAADVNHDGQVKAADALNILKMAVKLSSAPEKEWLFVPESVGSESMSRTHVVWPDNPIPISLDMDQELHLIGIVKGDVNGSWVA